MPDFIPPALDTTSAFADMRGHHVAIRTPSLPEAKAFYVDKLDFRVVQSGTMPTSSSPISPRPNDDHFYVEVLGGGAPLPLDVRPYTDLGDSLKYAGYHHFCLNVSSIEETVGEVAPAWRDHRHRALRAGRHQPQAGVLLRPVRQPDRAGRGAAVSGALLIVGAGPGIGEATAERFGREGWTVVVSSRSPRTVDPMVARLIGNGVMAHGLVIRCHQPSRRSGGNADGGRPTAFPAGSRQCCTTRPMSVGRICSA